MYGWPCTLMKGIIGFYLNETSCDNTLLVGKGDFYSCSFQSTQNEYIIRKYFSSNLHV